jgi:DNA-directed RNA polymerase subunit K/omega
MSDSDNDNESLGSDFFEDAEGSDKDSDKEAEGSDDEGFGFLDALGSKVKTPTASEKRSNIKETVYIYAPGVGEIDRRISPKQISIYEYAALIGHRATMIAEGSPVHPMFQGSGIMDLLKIAELELNAREIPFPLNIYRPIDNPTSGSVIEVFNPHEPGFSTPTERLSLEIESISRKNDWNIFNQRI